MSTSSRSSQKTALQVMQLLLPLTLLTGITSSMIVATTALESSAQASSHNQTPTELNFSGHCEYIGIQANAPAFRPIHERGAFANDSAPQCLHVEQ